MALTSAAFEDVIASSLYNEIVDLVNGATGGGEPVLLTDYSHATTPNLTVQSSHATGTPLRVKQTISAVEYDLLKVTNGATLIESKVYARNLLQYGHKVFDVPPITGPATAAIQTVIDAAKVAISDGQYWGATIRFQGLVYDISALDCTETHNLNFEGAAGMAGTMFRANLQTTAVHGADGKAAFDCAGSQSLTFNGIMVDSSLWGPGAVPAGSVRPMAAWFLGSVGDTGASPSSTFVSCTAFRLTNCAAQGNFGMAPLVTLFSSDHFLLGCSFAQYGIDRPAVLIGSADPIDCGTLSTMAPLGLPPVYGGGGGDITFSHCEAHCQPGLAGGYSAPFTGGAGDAIRIHGSHSVAWYRGPISGTGSSQVRLSGSNGAIVLDTLQHYTDEAAVRPSYIYRIDEDAVVNSLSIRSPSFNNVPIAGGSFFLIGADAQIDRLEFIAPDNQSAPATTLMVSGLYASATAIEILKWGTLDCMSFPLNLTSAGGNSPSIGAVELLNPGTITKTSTSTNKSRIVGDGFLTINGGGTKAPATAGLIRLQQNTGVFAANNANNANIRVIATDASDQILIGASTTNAAYYLDAVTSGTLAIAGTSRITVNTTGMGFFNATPIAKGTVTGSRGGNAALASLLTYLASLGLLTDSSS